jgi:peroxiredoxin
MLEPEVENIVLVGITGDYTPNCAAKHAGRLEFSVTSLWERHILDQLFSVPFSVSN